MTLSLLEVVHMFIGILLVITWLILLLRYPAKALPVSVAAAIGLGLVAMWVVWPVILPAAFWGWWRPKGLMPEKFLSFAVREFLIQKEVVYGTSAGTGTDRNSNAGKASGGREQSLAPRGSRAETKARRQQVKALRKYLSEHG